jgi:hypothetical protein
MTTRRDREGQNGIGRQEQAEWGRQTGTGRKGQAETGDYNEKLLMSYYESRFCLFARLAILTK